jgi:hypothetical protein
MSDWSLYRLVISPPDVPFAHGDTLMFAAPSDEDARYVTDLHGTGTPHVSLCKWTHVHGGQWETVEIEGPTTSKLAEFVTY